MCTLTPMHLCDLLECVCVLMYVKLVHSNTQWCPGASFPLLWGCLWFRQPHQGASVCACICLHVFESHPGSSQVQLGPSFLQTFLSCVRSRQARVIQGFLQPFSSHRYESQGDTDTTSQRQLSTIPRKDTEVRESSSSPSGRTSGK